MVDDKDLLVMKISTILEIKILAFVHLITDILKSKKYLLLKIFKMIHI
jgi:hypothetical protein